jgi:predicted metal-dependent HD superfamily phosphohydrolase
VGILEESWTRLWRGLGAAGDRDAQFEALKARYSEPWRNYHTLQHITECVELFSAAAHLAEHPFEVEFALWLHDAVYDLQAHDNEDRSAQLARSVLREAGVDETAQERVASLVLATKHRALPALQDEKLVVDIDLSILGAPPTRFDEYELQIRAEYAFVPDVAFKVGRAAVLRSFLERPRIYSTEHFHERLHGSARANLGRSLAALAG